MPASGSCLELLLAFGQLAVLGDDDLIGGDAKRPCRFGDDDDRCESRATLPSMPVPTSGDFGNEQRHALALHVRAHERAVRVVVLEERNQAGRDGDELLRRDVHVVDLRRRRLRGSRRDNGR